jgi:hypothetical protein
MKIKSELSLIKRILRALSPLSIKIKLNSTPLCGIDKKKT